MLNSDQKELIGFVQDAAPSLPMRKRIRVYRGLADLLPEKSLRNVFTRRAEILEQAENRCAELDLKIGGAE